MFKILFVAISLISINGMAQDCLRPKVTCDSGPNIFNFEFTVVRDFSESSDIPKCMTFLKVVEMDKKYEELSKYNEGLIMAAVNVKVDENLMVEISGFDRSGSNNGALNLSQTVMFQTQQGIPFKVKKLSKTISCVVE